jgi:hypothetical protein
MNNDDKRAEQLRQAAAGMTAIGEAFNQLGAAFLQGSREIGAVIAAIPRELPPIAPAAELPQLPACQDPAVLDRSAYRCDGKKWIAFRDYERQPGERGAEGRPEYLVREIWSGRETDALYTFDREWADRMYDATLDQAYVAELLVREAGDWQLIKRADGGRR